MRQAWGITGNKEPARALLEFADATVGDVTLEDEVFVAWQMVLLSVGWRCLGEYERALHWALQARSLVGAVTGPDHPMWAHVDEHLGRAIHPHERRGGCEEALSSFDDALRGYLGHGNGEAAAIVRLEISRCLHQLGQHAAGLEHARLAADYWAEHEPTFMLNRQTAHLLAGTLLEALGRLDEAEAEYEHLLTLVDLEASSEHSRNEARRALERLRAARTDAATR
ncbi:hypothetical protein [Paraliomyxa miuraensis]|uniref:hypothetical protein n=1 Tax=Paraliomyxa miuraensis TaxID=376150 RepID=UPI00224E9C7C|nr:hypothetical protein [Paraliomyxa miuraensis]MCX4247519.1 hypothetical protein [Paraliomyxa miuraensis]